jgi:hypothetical protein
LHIAFLSENNSQILGKKILKKIHGISIWIGVGGILCTSFFLTFWIGCRNMLPFNPKSLLGCLSMMQN